MYVATKAWIDPKKRLFFVGDFKNFSKERLIKSVNNKFLLSQWAKALKGQRVDLTSDDSVLSVGLGNNYLIRNASGIVRACHPLRTFGKPPNLFPCLD